MDNQNENKKYQLLQLLTISDNINSKKKNYNKKM